MQTALYFNPANVKGKTMANQTFKVAGITTHGDMTKVRFTDDLIRRVKQFMKGGATRVDLVDLPSSMTKAEALAYLQTHPNFQSKEDQMVIGDAISNRVKPKKEVKVKVDKKEKPNLDAIKARAKKKVTAEDIVAVAAESTTETKTEVEEQPQT